MNKVSALLFFLLSVVAGSLLGLWEIIHAADKAMSLRVVLGTISLACLGTALCGIGVCAVVLYKKVQ